MKYSLGQKILAWTVHGYTALGGIAGFFALLQAAQANYNNAFLLLLLSMVLDGTDGVLARKFKVKEVLPRFDGAMMDNVIDIFTYAWVPCFIIWKLNILPNPYFVILPIIASLYAYGQINMKTPDNYFLGFPTYWSIVAMYFYLLNLNHWLAAAIVIVFTVLSFVPTKYLYPSRNGYLSTLFWVLGLVWFVLVAGALIVTEFSDVLAEISLFYPVLYMAASFYVDFKSRHTQ